MRREDLVAREQKPHQTLIVVVPCVVLVFCCLPGLPLELPSDFRGVEYQPLDAAGAWKSKLARELHAAGLEFDPMNLL